MLIFLLNSFQEHQTFNPIDYEVQEMYKKGKNYGIISYF